MRLNLETMHMQKVKVQAREWLEEAKPGDGKSGSTVAFLKRFLIYVYDLRDSVTKRFFCVVYLH